ncbi:hypothetical protein ETB97_010467 [Aspergillus alliaceus]|uniref:Uncharacterized protein n=1 Tax=Petromyces alliaceus TaxID=209559 RepID=A0A5N7BYF6_PETAA|nr:uncharacterized protein BDW43DRAFT_102294 [Aspergillus alliaceus]KAB8232728.1 hypothetical protein BDW43DRAFT_102294 [Aspergillus alliaceus]KAE8386618.1 hypothetical protein BDV23DRAFT_196325 [Aspergillus alliaceus]KAF5863239.1 hypothetical protein ETB97_010467 [Aspergillus burnettii]
MPQFSPSPSPALSGSHHSIQPRRPSLEPEGEILSTRGQRLASLIRRRSISVQGREPYDDSTRYDELAASRDYTEVPPLERAVQLIGDVKPIYDWQLLYQDKSKLDGMRKGLRDYYERNNRLIEQYVYIDRLLDSSLPCRLIGEYQQSRSSASETFTGDTGHGHVFGNRHYAAVDGSEEPPQRQDRIKRTPRNLYRIPSECSHLLSEQGDENTLTPIPSEGGLKDDSFVDNGARIVTVAIYVNFIANIVLLVAKIVVMSMTNSLSVLASLVDGALDFLSTAIVWVATTLVRKDDRHSYPISRRRLEPLSVLVFAVVMMTSFVQVAITSLSQLISSDKTLVNLTIPSIAVMASTVVVKLACWFWCRLIKNSSVQALAQDAQTDVVFNLFSILFPLIGSFTKSWWVDPLGGLLLSVYIIWNWSGTAGEHIRHLTGTAASPIDHSVLLYMTMRFSKAILKIQNLRAYYAGDLLNVEVDIVLEGKTSLRDAHDIGESLQYMIESVPTVDRAFVHMDYDPWNIPSHMNQQEA